MIEFFKLEHCLRDFYGKVTQEPSSVVLETSLTEIRENLFDFDVSWSTFERLYVLELMNIEVQARSLIAKAIDAEKCLTSVEIREKMKGKILISCEDYLSARARLCEFISQINQIANYCGKGRDDLDHSILLETEGLLRRITKDQSKAIRILGEKIRASFVSIRGLLRKYDKNIEMVDPQLKNNSDLVELLMDYEKSWEKGANYFCDSEKRRHLLHFSGTIEAMSEKYEHFQEMVECSDADIFLIIPCILTLKSLDKDDKNLCKYFLPTLHQIDTKTFRLYFELEKLFEEWKRTANEHYLYYNILEKLLVGVDLSAREAHKQQQHPELIDRIVAKLKNIGMELHRAIPNEWNAFMEICMAGSITE